MKTGEEFNFEVVIWREGSQMGMNLDVDMECVCLRRRSVMGRLTVSMGEMNTSNVQVHSN